MDNASLAELFGWCASATSILLFLAPVSTFVRIVRERDVGHFDSLPYLVSLLQCLLWFSYCLVTPHRVEMITSCSVGIVFQAIWCILFFRYSSGKSRSLISLKFMLVLATWFGVTAVDMYYLPHVDVAPLKEGESFQTEALGLLASFVNVLMLGAPLGIVRHVIRTQSVEYMPFPLTAMVCTTSSFWIGYALLAHDMWVLVPNAAGLTLGLMQLVVYMFYCGRFSNQPVGSPVFPRRLSSGVSMPVNGEPLVQPSLNKGVV